jgi:outer membrane protein assembly factor BamB
VCNGAKETFCFEAKTGKILWSVPGGGWSTPAISGDFMALYASNPAVGISAYRLNLEKPQKLWAMPSTDRGASPVVHEGHVYVVGGLNKARAMCIQLESGKVTWDVPLPNTEIASPVVADGKILVVVGTSLYMIKADPEKYELLGKADLHVVTCTSPALVDGKAYLRLNDSVSCYDLTKAALSFPGRAAW